MNHAAELWKRTEPDHLIYLPFRDDDGCNQQVNAVVMHNGDWLVVWTMASEEGELDQRLVASRSEDKGKTWTAPKVIDGEENGNGHLATYGWPFVVPRTGRVYIFYIKSSGQITVRADITGKCKFRYSDDQGQTWQDGGTVDMGRGEFSHESPEADPNWIGIYSPIITSRNKVIAGFARYKAGTDLHKKTPYNVWETEVFFQRFDNILTEDDPAKITVTILPDSPRGLRVQRSNKMYWCNEPAVAELADGRLFAVLRTRNGCGYFAVSDDDGATWTTPAPLRYTNGGEKILNPNAPMMLYRLADGRIVLLHYINKKEKGTFGLRDPIYLSMGTPTPGKAQPVEFGPSRMLMTVHNKTVPRGTTYAQIGSYSSLLETDGKLYLVYNDVKHYVLIKQIPDSFLATSAQQD